MTIRELMKLAREFLFPREKMQSPKKQTRYTYTDGPMYYLGQQIVRVMQDAGYPAHIWNCYRSPEIQAEYKAKGTSKAGPWQSPHQFFEAVDILHPSKFWQVSPEYWAALAKAVKTVAEKFDVELEHGHYWKFTDSAHIQLKYWGTMQGKMRQVWIEEEEEQRRREAELDLPRKPYEKRRPNKEELAERFKQILPKVWATRPAQR